MAVVNSALRRNTTPIIQRLKDRTPPEDQLKILFTPGPDTTIQLASSAVPTADVLIAVGGDGTVSDVATAICGTDIPLGIIPAGSTNAFARELGIPIDPTAAIELLFASHRYARIDIGRFADRCFVLMAGAGLDSLMFAGTSQSLKQRVGWLAYVPPAIRNLFRPATRFTVKVDENVIEVESPLVLVANGYSIGIPFFRLYPGIQKNDGVLDVVIFTPRGRWQVIRTISRFLVRQLEQSPFVFRISGKIIEISADPYLPVEADGELVMQTPVLFSITPAALRVIVPNK